MEKFNPKRQIAIIWDIDDVKYIREDLNDEQAMDVLRHLEQKHDSDIGINWEVIECVADMLFPID